MPSRERAVQQTREDTIDCSCCGAEVRESRSEEAYGDLYCINCFCEYYNYCYSCDIVVDMDEAVYFRDDCYCQDCAPNGIYENIDRLESLSLPTSSICTHRSEYIEEFPVNRMVGVEVECMVPDEDGIASPENWVNCSDGSISSISGYSGVEMVSYPANSVALLGNISNIIEWRDTYGAIVNKSCGLHIHFNSLDMTAREVAHIGIVYNHFQEMLKEMMPNSRQDSNWCKDFTLDSRTLRNVDDEETLINLYYEYMMGSVPSTDKYNDARYCALNIHSRYYHGSLEFRLHSGTISKVKILNWIQILNCIVEKGIEISQYKEDEFKKYISTSYVRHIVPTFGEELTAYINKRRRKFMDSR